ncbi:MAG TPA: CHAD domain-containing protein [Chthonomonadales bacterium]|nr:CHAD domain-containing protein [Chthonomonadales bacterium]
MAQSPSFREYGVQVIGERLQKMLSYADAVRKAEDIEALHDMRVASRRLRAAIAIFAPAFRDPQFTRFEREVKALTDALGKARDLDVMINTLRKLELDIVEAERAGIEGFITRKCRERQNRQKDVLQALNRLQRRDLERWFAQIVAREDRTRYGAPEASTRV